MPNNYCRFVNSQNKFHTSFVSLNQFAHFKAEAVVLAEIFPCSFPSDLVFQNNPITSFHVFSSSPVCPSHPPPFIPLPISEAYCVALAGCLWQCKLCDEKNVSIFPKYPDKSGTP
jgi:hypothetical protein